MHVFTLLSSPLFCPRCSSLVFNIFLKAFSILNSGFERFPIVNFRFLHIQFCQMLSISWYQFSWSQRISRSDYLIVLNPSCRYDQFLFIFRYNSCLLFFMYKTSTVLRCPSIFLESCSRVFVTSLLTVYYIQGVFFKFLTLSTMPCVYVQNFAYNIKCITNCLFDPWPNIFKNLSRPLTCFLYIIN